MSEELTIGEVGRTLDRLETSMVELGHKIDNLSFVRRDVWLAEKAAILAALEAQAADQAAALGVVARDVADLKGGRLWLERLVLGFVVLALLGGLAAAYGIPGA